jgi:hypothetical protein
MIKNIAQTPPYAKQAYLSQQSDSSEQKVIIRTQKSNLDYFLKPRFKRTKDNYRADKFISAYHHQR